MKTIQTGTPMLRSGNPSIRLHASAVVLGESAVLVRGVSGSGKTRLCLQLIEAGHSAGMFARLIGDDRVELSPQHGRLLVRPVEAIAGVVERRGLGLTPLAHEVAACIRLVVDFEAEAVARLPEPDMLVTEVAGVTLPRLAFTAGQGDAAQVMVALALFNDEPWLR